MPISQQKCQAELNSLKLVPRKYYGQVFTTDPEVIEKLIQGVKDVHKPGTRIVEIGGGLGYITERLTEEFDDVESWEFDEHLFNILYKKFVLNENYNEVKEKSDELNKFFRHKSLSKEFLLRNGNILDFEPISPNPELPTPNYLLVGNIPFHISGKLYRKFMSDETHKPAGMVFITDKQYAKTLMGQPPRCYRVSLQAQAYGDIEIIADVPPTSVFPEPKVMSCVMKIIQNGTKLPENFWEVVNYHWENFPTKEVESPKTMGLKRWIDLTSNH